ncbi:hypothetical protein ETD86_05365 [Nonomuraea turkmeniaca]|uniref:CU044_5270 family protein n=1 Tax=Nonomuraea turkmeniaca TaxID=103838 RepID=A0A5S4FU03_9ACTN|nr:CU044_5270 family protein [Nonomuraea turkmeniaca]TMR24149.1 hypothetical protein ETD86_05365 [Nonomuraea turkmeniaca]
MTDRMFAELKPAALDELTEEAYRRRRSADLARAFASPRPAPRRRSRRPFLLLAGTVAAGLTAAATVVALSGESAAPRPPTPTPLAAQPVSPRSFLLAAATTAMREPATSGRYWYVRERTSYRVQSLPSDYQAKIKALVQEQKRTEERLKGDSDGLAAAKKEFERKVTELKMAELPYLAFAADTRESWRAMKQGEPGRTVSNQDVAVTFGSPADEAAWQAAGSPKLVDEEARTRVDDTERVLSIDNPSLTLQNLSALPGAKDTLKRKLDALWQSSPNTANADKNGYLWQTAVDLMTAPLQPGTRSALFEALADQPGITSQGQATDTLGRTGVALSAPTAHTITVRLIIDSETAELLQYEMWDRERPMLKVTLEQMGWSDTLGERPKG